MSTETQKVETFRVNVLIGCEPEIIEVCATSYDAALLVLDDRGYDLADADDIERLEALARVGGAE